MKYGIAKKMVILKAFFVLSTISFLFSIRSNKIKSMPIKFRADQFQWFMSRTRLNMLAKKKEKEKIDHIPNLLVIHNSQRIIINLDLINF